MKQYSTGELSKIAGVSNRTLRYYDKIGLLKPCVNSKNNYREYSEEDLIQLQQILLYKSLGFSLQDIKLLLLESEKEENILDSFILQKRMIEKKLDYYKELYDQLCYAVNLLSLGNFGVSNLIEIMELLNNNSLITNQYKDAKNLETRIRLHQLYSKNKINWFEWLNGQIELKGVNKLLELGCGNGEFWKKSRVEVRNREIYLSDISEGMLNDTKKNLGDKFIYIKIDCQNIPFKDNYFDCIIANHVLFYVKNLDLGLQQICRTLNSKGVFYSTTYSQKHMKEINDVVFSYDPNIRLSNIPLHKRFGFENGEIILSKFFNQVQKIVYSDELLVDQSKPLVDYILSCHGNQYELVNRYKDFVIYIDNLIEKYGGIRITKEACLFVCKGPKK